MQHIDLTHDFALPLERVFAYLARHENLGEVFGLRVRRVKEGATEPDGVGSVRELSAPGLPAFEETVTAFEQDRLIAYRISKGSPLRGHAGRMEFSRLGSGSRLHYTMQFGAVVPLLDVLVKAVLQNRIRSGLRKVDLKA